MLYNVLRVIGQPEVKESSKLGCKYKVVRFCQFQYIGEKGRPTGMVKAVTVFPKRKVTLKDGSVVEMRADDFYDFMEDGFELMGTIQEFQTTDYVVGTTILNKITVVVPEGKNGVEIAARQIANQGAKVWIDKNEGVFFEWTVRKVEAKAKEQLENNNPQDNEETDVPPVVTDKEKADAKTE